MTPAYQLGNKLYLNITNRCPCDCVFCIRLKQKGVGDGGNLWLEREPEPHEIIESVNKRDLSLYNEVAFCGYGEPTENLDTLLIIGRYLKENFSELSVRLNTNGLSDIINNRRTAPLFKDIIDTVSISLNAGNAKKYGELTRPSFDTEEAFNSMINFAVDCKRHVKTVIFTVVDALGSEELAECRALSDKLDIPLRLRELI